jgi:hypothetical protein
MGFPNSRDALRDPLIARSSGPCPGSSARGSEDTCIRGRPCPWRRTGTGPRHAPSPAPRTGPTPSWATGTNSVLFRASYPMSRRKSAPRRVAVPRECSTARRATRNEGTPLEHGEPRDLAHLDPAPAQPLADHGEGERHGPRVVRRLHGELVPHPLEGRHPVAREDALGRLGEAARVRVVEGREHPALPRQHLPGRHPRGLPRRRAPRPPSRRSSGPGCSPRRGTPARRRGPAGRRRRCAPRPRAPGAPRRATARTPPAGRSRRCTPPSAARSRGGGRRACRQISSVPM